MLSQRAARSGSPSARRTSRRPAASQASAPGEIRRSDQRGVSIQSSSSVGAGRIRGATAATNIPRTKLGLFEYMCRRRAERSFANVLRTSSIARSSTNSEGSGTSPRRAASTAAGSSFCSEARESTASPRRYRITSSSQAVCDRWNSSVPRRGPSSSGPAVASAAARAFRRSRAFTKWVRIFSGPGKLIDSAGLVSERLSGSIASG